MKKVNQTIQLRQTYKIQSTANYKIFKNLEGNRDREHVSKLIHSIEENGFLMVPILVNEKYEIIDGQGRFEALKFLELPVYYVIMEGLGISHCRKLNVNQSNWKNRDFIKSYSIERTDYKYLELLLERFPQFQEQVVATTTGMGVQGGGYSKKVRDGSFKCTPEQYSASVEILNWLEDARPFVEKIKGNVRYTYFALIFAYKCDLIDNKKLMKKFKKYSYTIDGVVNAEDAVNKIEKVYNRGVSGEKFVNLTLEYKKAIKKERE